MKLMKQAHATQVKEALERRGFSAAGVSPRDTMVIGDTMLECVDLLELFDVLITRRQKLVLIPDAGASYDDVLLAIEAVTEALRPMIGG